jgi:hypothetical protein
MPRLFALLNHHEGHRMNKEVSALHPNSDETPTARSNILDEAELERELCTANSRKSWIPENISSYVPIVISLLALFLTVYSAFETRLHDRLSAAPYIQFYYQLEGGKTEVGLYYKNTGLGPATLSSVRAYFDGRRIKSFDEISDKTYTMYQDATPTWDYDLTLGYDASVPSNDKIKMFFTKIENLRVSINEFGDMIKTRLFIILYMCSMYRDCTYNCNTIGDEKCRSEEIRLDPASANIEPSSRY